MNRLFSRVKGGIWGVKWQNRIFEGVHNSILLATCL